MRDWSIRAFSAKVPSTDHRAPSGIIDTTTKSHKGHTNHNKNTGYRNFERSVDGQNFAFTFVIVEVPCVIYDSQANEKVSDA
jgi:hypothetical protein